MSKTVTVELEAPIEGHEGQIRQIVLREPKYKDIMGHGQPYTLHNGPGGEPIVIYDQDAITHYVEACCVKPDALLLTQLGLRDTFKVRGAILDFFLPRAAAGAGSETSPQTSGSAAGSSQTPSET